MFPHHARLAERTDLPQKIAALVSTLGAQGVSARAVLDGTGIEPAQLADPGLRVSALNLLQVLRRASELNADASFALRAGLRLRATQFGLYGYALLGCATPREAIGFALRYRALATPLLGLRAQESDTRFCWQIEDSLPLGLTSELFRLACELQLGTQLALHRELMGAGITPSGVCLPYPAPAHAGQYATLLACPVEFDAPGCEMAFEAQWLERPITTPRPSAGTLARETCERLLAQLPPVSGVALQVCQLLLEQPGRFPDREGLARRLGISSRTLHRQLLAEGCSYQTLLDRVRHRLASDYLSTTSLTIEDVAAALGFSDAANFRQALKRWSGLRPSAFRARGARQASARQSLQTQRTSRLS